MTIKLIRHATLLLKVKNKTLLIDLMLANKGEISAVPNVPNKSNNPLVALPVPKKALLTCDSVLITHHHRDHFDDAAINAIPKEKLIFCQPKDEKKISGFGFSTVHSIKDTFCWNEIQFIRTGGKHGTGLIGKAMGPVSGYFLQTADEPTLYIAGDTVWCKEVEKTLSTYHPDVTVVFSGAARMIKGCAITMTAEDIEQLSNHAPNTKVVSVHMESFNHCLLLRNELQQFLEEKNLLSQVRIPDNGDVMEFIII
jgi:L-ascorbate metabolism protein UlaG (beta-lactamase superfamily)